MNNIFKPDIGMAQQFLNKLSEDNFTFQTFDDNKTKDPRKSKVLHGSLIQHSEELIRLNLNGAGVFVMVNCGDGVIHSGKNTCRTNDNIIAVRALFADADGSPIGPILERCPPPHILVESSPGKWHIYWIVNDTKLEEFKPRQIALATSLGTDPSVNDLARVLRVPGFYHQKSVPFMSRLITN